MTIYNASAATYTKAEPNLENVFTNKTFKIDDSKLKSNQILLKTVATPVNPSDIAQVSGSYPSPPTLQQLGQDEDTKGLAVGGNEGYFKIISIGSKINDYNVGDLVIPKLPSFGTWRSYAIVEIDENDSTPLIIISSANDDKKLSLVEGATISINPSTALQMTEQFIQDWQPNDWIVSNAGNSIVNKFLVQIAKFKKINTILVIRSGKPDEVELRKELHDLGATKVITETEFYDKDFSTKELPKILNGGKLRLGLNSVGGGEAMNALINSLSQDGIIATYGISNGEYNVNYNLGLQLFKNLSTRAFWLTKNTRLNPESKVKTVKTLIDYYKKGIIKSVNFNQVSFNEDDDLKSVLLKTINDSKHGKQVIIYN